MRRAWLAATTLAAALSSVSALAQERADSVRQYVSHIRDGRALLALQDFLNDRCRGDADDQRSCDDRDIVVERLSRLGWCHGRPGEYGYQMKWHRCGRNSIR